MVEILQAQADDVAGIAQLKTLIWPDEVVNVSRVAEIISASEHVVHVALAGDQVVGFVDGFMTLSAAQVRRWEVDLLAVHPDYRRQGIAERLIAANTESGRSEAARMARSLIRVNNAASMHAFATCGYRAQADVCGLYVALADVRPAPQIAPGDLYLVQVNSINYQGIWMEGDLSPDGFLAASALCARNGLDLVGAVIPLREGKLLQAAQATGYRLTGYYRYWLLDL